MAWKIEGLLERLGIHKDNTVGLALSGGGAKGFSHIGVLMAFENFGIFPDVLSGVSAGSIAAALYGSGLTPQDMVECFTEASSFGDFTEWSLPKEGFMKLNRFGKLLQSWLPVSRLEEMKTPTVICATDIDNGKSVGWGKGEIVPRVMASCSIPIIFNPVRINGVNYVDGGVLRNLPAWAIRDYCDTLYGSNCSPMRKHLKTKTSIIDIAYRTFHLMMKSNTPQDIRLCDHVIAIQNMSNVRTFELSSLKKGVTAGYDAACRVLERIHNN
ncbi:MAG: patatin-like phospholipase family protein [Muribaculaceae bacterium]|nr:patatin-like phospholipase family protein [Muribaculaceae bacterium]